ncbi:hypothetical protein PG999_001606 [Apiospora kogelbergensis]|uniref:Uncharacterized protein n=1 Tax=Apiospora kogelbergensis TaxID=1337665 RepID=A0AAW0R5Y2_9PEZI
MIASLRPFYSVEKGLPTMPDTQHPFARPPPTSQRLIRRLCSHRDNNPAAQEQFVVRLGRELVRRGAPLDTNPVFLRHAAVKPIALLGVWGARMQTLAKKKSKSTADQVANAATEGIGEEVAGGGGSVVPDTTPLAWAIRTGGYGSGSSHT